MRDTTSFETATCDERKDLFQLGDFLLSSGKRSNWKLECDSLTDGDIATLANLIRQMIGSFSEVHGVPSGGRGGDSPPGLSGGIRLAQALKPHALGEGNNAPILIVDDVLTTGVSIDKVAMKIYEERKHTLPLSKHDLFKGAVLFARGQCPMWVRAVFQMPECFWVTPRVRGS
jgi:hypothetical protein